jgi:hypothetical protein
MRSPHHYRELILRWRALARASGLAMQPLAQADGFDLIYLTSPALPLERGIYISAGIHGDEPASSAALISWAEKNVRRLSKLPLLIFPALNPWGLVNNVRLNAEGADLNRAFHRDDLPVIHAVKRVAAPLQFALALMLHEDYDAEGFYVYEAKREEPYWGEALLGAVSRVMPIDPRRKIDGRNARGGLIRRRFDRRRFEQLGFPEAIWLHEFHARRALTVETPSEFAIEQRIRAHEVVLDECVRRVLAR